MDRKKLMIGLIGCIVAIFVLVTIKNFHHKRGSVYELINEVTNKVEQHYSEDNQNEMQMDKLLEELSQALREEDYDKMYEMMDQTYLGYKFANDQNQLKEYMKQYVGEDANLQLQLYEEFDDGFLCSIVLYRQKEAKVLRCLITKKDGDPYQFAFDDIGSLKEYDIEVPITDTSLEIKLKYIMMRENGAEYVLEISNLEQKDVKYELSEIVLEDVRKNQFPCENKNIELKSADTCTQALLFENYRLFAYPSKMIELKLTNLEKNEQSEYVTINLQNIER